MLFTSMITPVVLIVLYATFLAKVFRCSFTAAIPDMITISDKLINGTVAAQLTASLMAVSCITVTFCVNLTMVQDKANGIRKDFNVSPVSRGKIYLGYFLSTVANSLMVNGLAFVLCLGYLLKMGWYMNATDVLWVLFDMILLVLFGSTLSSIISFPLTTQGQLSAVGTIVSAGYGFICGAYMPISEKAIGTISNRIRHGGTSFSEPGLIRDLVIASKFSKPVSVYAVQRIDPETKKAKLFAVMSDKYTVIPQETVLDIIDKVKAEALKDLGRTECNNWLIDHSVTRIYLDFPDCGSDFAEEYKLPDEMVPGIMIETSDIGDSSLRLKGYFRLGGNLTYVENEFTQIHTGELRMSDVIDVVADKIFPEYRIYPEKLAKFMMIDITEPTMSKAARIKKMTSLYRDVSRKIGLVKAIGKKREKSLIDQLIAGINPEIDYTAYDIAQTFLILSSTIEVENKSVVELISNTVRNVMEYNFDDKDDEITVI